MPGTLTEEFSGVIVRVEAGNSEHPSFIEHLTQIRARLVAYRDVLLANNLEPGRAGGWGDY